MSYYSYYCDCEGEGCVWCEEEIPQANDLEAAQQRMQKERELRAVGKPTLHVSLGDILSKQLLAHKEDT